MRCLSVIAQAPLGGKILQNINLHEDFLQQKLEVICIYEGMTLKQLAFVMDISVNNVIHTLFQLGEVVTSTTSITLFNKKGLSFDKVATAIKILGFTCIKNEWFNCQDTIHERALSYANYYNVVSYKIRGNNMIFEVSKVGTADTPKSTWQYFVNLQTGQERGRKLDHFVKRGLINCKGVSK